MIKRFSPTLKRIVILAAALTFATQLSLVYIGLTYMDSIDKSLNAKRSEDMLYQFQQNVLYQLNDIDNLMLLLQTPEFSDYYKNLMRLRDDDVVNAGKHNLAEKLGAINLSPDSVQSIYFLGQNFLQRSLRMDTGSTVFGELPRLDLDRLHYSKLDKLFLPDRDRLTYYTEEDFNRYFRTDNPMLEEADISDLKAFMSALQGHLLISNGNENGVFILIVLSDRFFSQAIPANRIDESYFSVVGGDNRLLWTSAPVDPLHAAEGKDPGEKSGSKQLYQNDIKRLDPFGLSIVYSEGQRGSGLLRSQRLYQMSALSLLMLILTSLFSYIYLRQVFKPFRLISKQIKGYTLSNEWLLRPLPGDLIRKGFHAVSMRSKLILVLIAAVCLPAITDGIMYSYYSKHDIQREMTASQNAIGQYSAVSIRNRLQFTENILKEISASQQFQDYVTENYTHLNAINLSTFPGLNDISYFVLLDENGNCLYSSIFSNNKAVFNTDKNFLLDENDPYWISDYKNVFNPLSTALVKRIGNAGDSGTAAYLLMVPKESIFENIDSGAVDTSYTIANAKGKIVYTSQARSDAGSPEQQLFKSVIPNTDWTLSVGFVFNDVLEKNRGYQEQFLLSLSIVLLLSIVAAIMIASLLVRPIHRLKEAMLRAGNGELALHVDNEENTEIGGIIRSYNRMINQLDQLMREENELIAMKTRAELDMLQAQINPHFLYNTLEVINMRSMKSGNTEISAIVSALADLFRYSVAKGSDMVDLDMELSHAANYITIQQIRFGHSFEVEYDVPDELRSLAIMRFVLQPIIENAIKHGFAGWEEGGLIVIAASMAGANLQLRITDNGMGMDRETLLQLKADMEHEFGKENRERSGIGVRNVYQRLKLVYKDRMSMTISSGDMEGTEVILTIPVQIP